jgi:hypothetical protein
MKKENTTMVLIDMLVQKYNLNKQKVVDYIVENGNKKSSFKLFLSGFMFELSSNQNNLKTKLS